MTALGIAMEPYVVKCGTTTIPLEERLRQIGQDRYGAAVRTETGIVAEPGFTRWMRMSSRHRAGRAIPP